MKNKKTNKGKDESLAFASLMEEYEKSRKRAKIYYISASVLVVLSVFSFLLFGPITVPVLSQLGDNILNREEVQVEEEGVGEGKVEEVVEDVEEVEEETEEPKEEEVVEKKVVTTPTKTTTPKPTPEPDTTPELDTTPESGTTPEKTYDCTDAEMAELIQERKDTLLAIADVENTKMLEIYQCKEEISDSLYSCIDVCENKVVRQEIIDACIADCESDWIVSSCDTYYNSPTHEYNVLLNSLNNDLISINSALDLCYLERE